MKVTELFEAIDPTEERTRKDWTKSKFQADRPGYEKEREQKLGGGGTLVTLYNDAINNANKGNHKKLDELIVASIIASNGFDRALIDRSVSLEDALRRDIKVGVVRGKNFGTYQEDKTVKGYIQNGGNLDNVIVSKKNIKDESGKPTKEMVDVGAREYWTSRYNDRTSSPMINSKMWLHTEHGRIQNVVDYLNSTPANISAKRINELLSIMTQIEKHEAKPEFKKGKETAREIQQAANIKDLETKKVSKKEVKPVEEPELEKEKA